MSEFAISATVAASVLAFDTFLRVHVPQISEAYHTAQLSGGTLGRYYYDMRERSVTDEGGFRFDADGVRLRKLPWIEAPVYSPIAIIQTGLGAHDLYLESKDAEHLARFRTQLEWVLAALQGQDDGAAYLYATYDFPAWGMTAPWVSGMYQGQALSLLLRAHQLEQDPSLLDCAWRVYDSYHTPVEDGGFRLVDGQGHVWFEEYPRRAPQNRVLNGFISALFGLWDLYRVSRDSKVKGMFDEGVATVDHYLPRYDAGWWSYYDIREGGRPWVCDNKYGLLHITQLELLAEMAPERENLGAFAARWRSYLSGVNRLRFRARRAAQSLSCSLHDGKGRVRLALKFGVLTAAAWLVVRLVSLSFRGV